MQATSCCCQKLVAFSLFYQFYLLKTNRNIFSAGCSANAKKARLPRAVPIVIVSKQLGHAQVSTTANIYAHAIKSAQARAVEVFDRFEDIINSKENENGKGSQNKGCG